MKKTVVITRPSGPYSGAAQLAQKLTESGFAPFELPLLTVQSIEPTTELLTTIRKLLGAARPWLAFLSPTAVCVFREFVARHLPELVTLSQVSIAAQGTGTAKAVQEKFGRYPDFVPSVFIAEEFAREFAERLAPEHPVLVPQSAEGRDVIVPTLQKLGRSATSFDLYRLVKSTIEPTVKESLQKLRDESTFVVFMSPSAVRAAVEEVGAHLGTKKLVSVGPITSQALRKAGLTVWREATEHSEDGVLELLREVR